MTLFANTGGKKCRPHSFSSVYIQVEKSVPTLFVPSIYTGEKECTPHSFSPV